MPDPTGKVHDVCRYVQKKGLHCLEQKGNLRILSILDRPAVLMLSDGVRGDYYVLLKKVHGQNAVVVIGNETRIAPLAEIEQRWLGEYLLLWRPPSQYAGTVYPGKKGPIVKWLDTQLSVIDGVQDKRVPTDIYHNEMVQRIKQFQAGDGLDPDGIVGPQTFMCVLNKAGTSEPMLSQE
jgi:general secretion pathway protein A